MISNRKARLLLGVPNARVGEVSQYRISNHFWLMTLDNGHRWGSHRKRNARQNRRVLRWVTAKKEAVRRGVYESLMPHVGKPLPEATLSIGRQIHVEAEKIVSESPDLSITLLDGAGKPVADFACRRFVPDSAALAQRVINDLNQRTEEMLRKVIRERYGDIDLQAFAKDSLRKCWPDREEYFYKNDLLLTVHKPRWDEITFEIHRGPENGN